MPRSGWAARASAAWLNVERTTMATANKVSVIPCGAMTADLTWLLIKPGRSITDRNSKDAPAPWVDVPTHCVLVETDEGRILWDTSCPRDWEERWGPTGLHDFFPYDNVSDEEYLDSRLNQMGIGLDQIDYVILSHLHFDHAGNAQMFKNTNAKLVCHEKEKDFAFGFDGLFTGAHLKTDYEGLTFETVSGDMDFLPGVKLIETPGHTVGCMSMQVDLPDTGTMIFTSDAVYMGESYGPPATPAAIVNNLEQFYASVEKLRAIQEETDATMVFGHDAEQIHQLRTAPEESYT
jgi:glyoxylase-like metal-dependent hydrolase (beta-lactamase superfamily II)